MDDARHRRTRRLLLGGWLLLAQGGPIAMLRAKDAGQGHPSSTSTAMVPNAEGLAQIRLENRVRLDDRIGNNGFEMFSNGRDWRQASPASDQPQREQFIWNDAEAVNADESIASVANRTTRTAGHAKPQRLPLAESSDARLTPDPGVESNAALASNSVMPTKLPHQHVPLAGPLPHRGNASDPRVSNPVRLPDLSVGKTAAVRPAPMVELDSVLVGSTLVSTIQQKQLSELTRHALRDASDALNRGALHTAKKKALESLRAHVTMRDALAGTITHTKRLDTAMDALREAADFCGRFGPVTQPALQRMVNAHVTDTLKQTDLSDTPPIKAFGAYLAVAQHNLVAACGRSPEASEALALLGRIERHKGSNDNELYAGAVALAVQQAAVDCYPQNPSAHRELGRSLLAQGLPHQALQSLQTSQQIMPTRGTIDLLIATHRKTGNAAAASHYTAMLNDPGIPADFPIFHMTPRQFAETSLSAAKPMADTTSEANESVATTEPVPTQQPPTGASWFQFWRR